MNQPALRQLFLAMAVATAGLVPSSLAFAESITYVTPTGSSNSGELVKATAVFTQLDSQHLNVTLTNLQANPRSASQLLCGVIFDVGGSPTSAILSTPTAQLLTLTAVGQNINAQYTSGAVSWNLDRSGSTLKLIDGTFPQYTMIGPPDSSGKYTNANASLLKNHNPFIAESQTWTITLEGATSPLTISNLSFLFGTTATQLPGIQQNSVPEPSSVIGLLSLGLVSAAVTLRRRLRKS